MQPPSAIATIGILFITIRLAVSRGRNIHNWSYQCSIEKNYRLLITKICHIQYYYIANFDLYVRYLCSRAHSAKRLNNAAAKRARDDTVSCIQNFDQHQYFNNLYSS